MVACATSIFLIGAGFFIEGVFFISSKIGLTSFLISFSCLGGGLYFFTSFTGG